MKRRSICATMPSTVETTWPISPRVETCGSSTVTKAPFPSHSCIRFKTSRSVASEAVQPADHQFVAGPEKFENGGQFRSSFPACSRDLLGANDLAAFGFEFRKLRLKVLVKAAHARAANV